MRTNNRADHELRPIRLQPAYVRAVAGSVLVEQGDTRVVCTATIEDRVPPFLKNSGRGWITAEYGMLPGSCGMQRVARERQKVNNRHSEIQRFVGRALRTVFAHNAIGERTITIDADVIQADGGTRCASVNGGMVALLLALKYLVFETIIPDFPKVQWLAAVSLGIRGEEILVDLDYREDSSVDADINVVSTLDGRIVEVETFAEGRPVPYPLFQQAIQLGVEKNREIVAILQKTVREVGLVL